MKKKTDSKFSVLVKKETLDKLHEYCYPGETHDMFIQRLLSDYNLFPINVSEETWLKACATVSNTDPDEVLNVLMDRSRQFKRRRKK